MLLYLCIFQNNIVNLEEENIGLKYTILFENIERREHFLTHFMRPVFPT